MSETHKGFLLCLSAYVLWGVFPLFFKLLHEVSAFEIVAQRIVWAMPTALAVLFLIGRTGDIMPTLRSPKTLRMVALASILIAFNWGVYVYSIITDQALQASLGYFISPLLSVALGYFVLKEPLSLAKYIALALAFAGVVMQAVAGGQFPWFALALAGSFSCYSLVKKTISVGPAQGFFLETLLLLPLAVFGVAWIEISGQSVFFDDVSLMLLLIASGPVTALPLMLFAAGARRVALGVNGLMMYVVPTFIFLTAIFIFNEPINTLKLASFGMIWAALAIYTTSVLKRS